MNLKDQSIVKQSLAPVPLDPEKIMILVGFGKRDLSELVAMTKAGKEDEAMKASTNVPPRWRRLAICSEDDVDNMRTYTEFLSRKLARRAPGL
jgi:hypothetical protein